MSIDDKTLFKTPFTPAYWRCAISEFKSVKVLALAAIFIALRIVISSFFIPLPFLAGNQRIFFSFFVNALGSYIYGPCVALAVGFISDILGFFIAPSGGFFFGYTITAMMGSFIYALFLYRARISILRIILCKFCVNIFVNVCLNGLWDSMLAGKGYIALMAARIPKNLILLPFEIVLLILFLQLMIPIVDKMHLTPPQPAKRISNV